MPLPNLTIEMGKLMATVAALQSQLNEIKKEVTSLNTHLLNVHNELSSFMANVQPKSVCQRLHEQLKSEYVTRAEIGPFKTLLGTICATTVTAISVALLNLILK